MTVTKSLILVDDEDNITRSIKRLCRPHGFDIRIASSAKDALVMMAEEPAQVVLSDQLMPDMTGAEMFSELQITHPETVRVLLTGYTALEGLTKAVNEGRVFKILFKPWDDEHLINTLEEAFDYFHMKEQNRRLTEELRDLNQNLEQRVEEKTRELNLHIRRLQVAQSLFELFPEVAMGLSNDGIIVQANRRAREVFTTQPLVGVSARNALPEALLNLLETSLDNDFTSSPLEIGEHKINFELVKSKLNNELSGFLLFGHQC